jgi:hypothetical protein
MLNCFVLLHATDNVQLRCVSGIASAHHSHVKQFPNVAAYDDYYDIVVDAAEIGIDQFARRVQSLLVQYLRASYGDDTTNWCERFWTGDRGRYCLVHSRYAGCNNNMGVEVTWRDIKKSCDCDISPQARGGGTRDAAPSLQLSDMKMVLMPRLNLLTQLDPEGLYEFNAPQMRE